MTETVKPNVPAVVGVPESVPALKVSPGGVPDPAEKVYGAVPPDAVTVAV